jgi:mono/diheme cytochrome c family protein
MKASASAAAVLGLLGLSLGLGACASSGGDDKGGTAGGVGDGKFQIFPPKVFAGYGGGATFKAPIIAVNNAGAVTWTLGDDSLATLAPESDGTKVMITAKKAGTTTITASSGGKTTTAPIEIYSYTAEVLAAGMKRYMAGPDAMNPACLVCHAKGIGPDHTPTELDADEDEEIQQTIVTGKDPEGRPIGVDYPMIIKDYKHTWTVTEQEKVGLVAYMRSLPPSGFPEYDEATTTK